MNIRELIGYLEKSDTSKLIPNLSKIILKLKEMDSIVEMEDVKKSFVSQLLLILTMKKNGHNPPFKKMHSILSGPPGVGKTTMSIIIAEIWGYLGIINKQYDKYEKLTDFRVESKRDISNVISKIQDKITDITLDLEREYADGAPDHITEIYNRSKDSLELCEDVICRYSKHFNELEDDDLRNYDINCCEKPYIVLGRGDFVGQYQGDTSIKTKEILEANKGKVIILEEAYLFCNGERDSYGLEAITLINRYMDEHQDDYIFIFNGYTEKLEETIFKAQPGLKRRIQWTFDIKPYTSKGLFDIFEYQLSKFNSPEWKILEKDRSKFIDFFKTNKSKFPYYGGDTENLILKCQLEYGKQNFLNSDVDYTLDYNILKNSFVEYCKNRNFNEFDPRDYGIL